MEENLGAFEEKRNEAAETAESASKGGKHLAKGGKRGWAIAGIALGVLAAAYLGLWGVGVKVFSNVIDAERDHLSQHDGRRRELRRHDRGAGGGGADAAGH